MSYVYNDKYYTYDDYLNWPNDERIELIDGVVYSISPSPAYIHQKTFSELLYLLTDHVKKNNINCHVLGAPFDVEFSEMDESDNKKKNVVQPDIFVVFDDNKVTDQGCMGSPDLIFEIVASSSTSKDYVDKVYLYSRNRIKEYIIVNPKNRTVTVYTQNEDNKFDEPEYYKEDLNVKINTFDDLVIDFSKIMEF